MAWEVDETGDAPMLANGRYAILLSKEDLTALRALQNCAEIIDKVRVFASNERTPREDREKLSTVLNDGRTKEEHAQEIWDALHAPAGKGDDDD